METTKINLNAAIEAKIQEIIKKKRELHVEYPEMAEDDNFAIPSADKKYWKKTRGFEYRELKVPVDSYEIFIKLDKLIPNSDWRFITEGLNRYALFSIWAPKNGEYKQESNILLAIANSVNLESYDSDLITLQRELIELAGFYLKDHSKTIRNDGKVGKGWDNW